MKNREFWIDLPKKKNYDIMCFSDDQLLDKSVKDELIHVIDATGMPTKEKIRLACRYFEMMKLDSRALTCDKKAFYEKVLPWLKKLAAE